MLHDWEFAQNLCGVHLEHAFVDFTPASRDTTDVVKSRRVLPKWSLLDIVDELYGGEIHVRVLKVRYHGLVGHGRGRWSSSQ